MEGQLNKNLRVQMQRRTENWARGTSGANPCRASKRKKLERGNEKIAHVETRAGDLDPTAWLWLSISPIDLSRNVRAFHTERHTLLPARVRPLYLGKKLDRSGVAENIS